MIHRYTGGYEDEENKKKIGSVFVLILCSYYDFSGKKYGVCL